MRLPLFAYPRCLKLVLLLLYYATTLFALSLTDLEKTFNLRDPSTGPGGCDRNAPNGVYMQTYVLTAVTDAFSMAEKVYQQIDLYGLDNPSSKRLRALLYIFFGITFDEDFELTERKVKYFNYVKGPRSLLWL